jgi:hypothetical protein
MVIIMNFEIFYFGGQGYGLPTWTLPLMSLGGILLLTITMHLAKFIGKLHGRWAKLLLVND